MKFESIQSLVDHMWDFDTRPAVGLRQSFGVRWWSYRRLSYEAYQFAARLQDWDIPPGARVLMWAPNCPEWVAYLMGALLSGVVVVPVDEGASERLVQRIAHEVNPSVLIHGPEQNIADFDVRKVSIYMDPDWNRSERDERTFEPVNPDDPAFLLYTSGTTQEPKGVVLTHKNILTQVGIFTRWYWLLQWIPIRLLALSPLSHIQGLMLGAIIPLSVGLSVLYSNSVNPHHVIRTIRQNRVTVLLAVPRVQHLLVEALKNLPSGRMNETLAERVGKIGFFPLRRHFLFLATHAQLGYSFWVLLVGGANLPREDERFWYECGYVLAQGYGLTETAALVSIKINSPFFAHLGSIGKPIGGQEVVIDEDGEVLVKGENVSPGYFQNQKATDSLFQNGYLRTGDLARKDNRDRLYFEGRKKEIIVTDEGHNVYPQDIEAVLNLLPGVCDSTVIGYSEVGLTEVHAVLLLDEGVDAHQIILQANQLLETHQRIHSWSRWPNADFPRTSLRKVKRQVVQEQIIALWGEPSEEENTARPLTLAEIIGENDRLTRMRALARYLSDNSTKSQPFQDQSIVETFGLGSLDLVELLILIEKEGGIIPSNISVSQNTSVADLHAVAISKGISKTGVCLPVREPWWSRNFPGRLLRLISQPALIKLWLTAGVSLSVDWTLPSAHLQHPFLVAAAPHRHWLDTFVIYSALPHSLRHRLVVVTNWDFSDYFAPRPRVRSRDRWIAGLAYYLLVPLVYSFVIVPNFGTTREGLYELGKVIDQGHIAITFPKGLYLNELDATKHEPGVARIVLQTQLPILPIWIEGNDTLHTLPRQSKSQVLVRIGAPINVTPRTHQAQLIQSLESAFRELSSHS